MSKPGRREIVLVWLPAATGALALFLHLRDEAVSWPMGGALHVGAAASLAQLEGWRLPSGRPFAVYGPVYPALLAVGRVAGADVVPTVYALHAIAWGAGVVSSYALGRRCAGPWTGALAACAYALLGSTNVLVRTVLPDHVAIALMLSCLALASSAPPLSIRRLVALGAIAGLAAATRYTSLVTLVPLLAVVLARREGLRRAATFLVVATAPIGLWMLRNEVLTGHLTGMARFRDRFNDRALLPWEDVAAAFRIAVHDLFSPSSMGLRHVVYLRELPLLPALVAVVAIVAVILAATVPRRAPLSACAHLCAAFAGTHVAVTLLVWAVGNNDPLVSRYLAPAWPPLIVVLLDLAARVRLPWTIAPASALVWIAGASTVKSVAILSNDPSGDLVERHRSTQSGDTWRRSVPWELEG